MVQNSTRYLVTVIAIILAVTGLVDAPAAYAVTPTPGVTVDWGVVAGDPLFDLGDTKPCDVTTRTITVHNDRSVAVTVAVTSSVTETSILPDVQLMHIYSGATEYYGAGGSKTMSDFFADSAGSGIPLGTIAANSSKSYTFTITFPCSAGNEYQKKKLIFDISLHFEDPDGGPTPMPTATPTPVVRPTPTPTPIPGGCGTPLDFCAIIQKYSTIVPWLLDMFPQCRDYQPPVQPACGLR